jgi:hypothetical protein
MAQGCQMVFWLTENPNLGIFGGPWNRKCWYIYFIAIPYILWPIGIIWGSLVHFSRFGLL